VPLRARADGGNENDQRSLLALVDDPLADDLRPGERWADRGDDAEWLREALRSALSRR
jgi:hypothetical protein